MTAIGMDVLLAVSVSLGLGLFVSVVYWFVIPRFRYSVSVLYGLVYLAMIVSLVMIVISNQVARAFTLVGALAVIRFRTPVKDVRDAAFLFLALAAGMGTGVGLYLETALGTILIGVVILILHLSEFGLPVRREVLVKMTIPNDAGGLSGRPDELFKQFTRKYRMLNARSVEGGRKVELSFTVHLPRKTDMPGFSRLLASAADVEDVSVIAAEEEDLTDNIF